MFPRSLKQVLAPLFPRIFLLFFLPCSSKPPGHPQYDHTENIQTHAYADGHTTGLLKTSVRDLIVLRIRLGTKVVYNMAAAMRKVHIVVKNRISVFPLSILTLKVERIGENVTESVLKKVCADRSKNKNCCFNSIKNKETTSPYHLTRGRSLRLHSVLTSSLAFLVQFSMVLLFGLAGRFQDRSKQNLRSSQGTNCYKFPKKHKFL